MIRLRRGMDDGFKKGIRRGATSACRQVLAEFGAVSTDRLIRSGIRGKPRRRFDEGQPAEGDAGLHKAVTVMGNIARLLPVEIPQVAVDGEAGIVAQQNLAGVYRF